jgi:DhnA family fructose-bisphosphate aldolase class Ia
LPAVVETTLWGRRIENDLDGEKLLHANRIGFETGADVLKTFYPDDPGVFDRIVEHSPVPVYVAGGEAGDNDVETLRTVKSVIDAGAAGIMFGRTIWQHDEPAAMIGAIRKIVQEDESVSVAAEQLS